MDKFDKIINEYTHNYSNDVIFCLEEYSRNHSSLLLEKTFDIDEDVDYVWDNGYRQLVTDYIDNPARFYKIANNAQTQKFYSIKSSSLPSQFAIKATNNNPIVINIGLYRSNSYQPNNKVIELTLNYSAVNYLNITGLDNSDSINEVPQIVNEFNEESLKASIAHEITHWLEDSLHNSKIKKALQQYKNQINKSKLSNFNKNFIDVFKLTSGHELESVIHEIKQIKRNVSEDKWNNMTFKDLASIKPKFNHYFNKIQQKLDKDQIQDFVKKFYSRLNREGLLGNKMRNIDLDKI